MSHLLFFTLRTKDLVTRWRQKATEKCRVHHLGSMSSEFTWYFREPRPILEQARGGIRWWREFLMLFPIAYPLVIKHVNGKYTIYRWFSYWNPNFQWISNCHEGNANTTLVSFAKHHCRNWKIVAFSVAGCSLKRSVLEWRQVPAETPQPRYCFYLGWSWMIYV